MPIRPIGAPGTRALGFLLEMLDAPAIIIKESRIRIPNEVRIQNKMRVQ